MTTVKNIFVENSEYVCVECGRGIDITAMRAADRVEFKRHGLCPECAAAKKAEAKAAAAVRKAEREAAKAAAAEKRAKNPSAASQIRALIESATFDDEQLAKMKDVELTKAKTKVSFQLLKEINPEDDWELETYYNGGLRYQKKPVVINGKVGHIYMTNNLYSKNIPLVKRFLVEIGSLEETEVE